MINLKDIKNQKFNQIRLIEILFYTFPLSFIIGNLVLSLHLVLFILTFLLLIMKNKLNLRFKKIYWLLIFFFIYIIILTAIQFQIPGSTLNEEIQDWPLKNNPIFKSFILLRFLVFIFVIDTLFFNKILNIGKIFLFSFICTSFVSLDIIIQYLIGYDLFGIEYSGARNSGPFGDEKIAGTYLQRFSFFSIFYIFIFLKNKNFVNLLLIFIITLIATATFLSGNKMPMILFLFGCFLIFLFIKNLRLVVSLSMIAFLSIFIVIITNDENFKYAYSNFFKEINFLKKNEIKLGKVDQNPGNDKEEEKEQDKKIFLKRENLQFYEGGYKRWIHRIAVYKSKYNLLRGSGHDGIYRTTILMWKDQPLLGFGLKSFRIKCWEYTTLYRSRDLRCSSHSHNYYLELLSETGIIGASLIIIFFLIILKDSFYYIKKNYRVESTNVYLFIPILLTFFLEIWPLKSTGSFFTTWNATFFWLTTAMLFSILYKKNN